MVDMAHFAGLVAAGVHPTPVPHADVVTTTTHKTLRGPRGGMILCQEPSTPRRSTRRSSRASRAARSMHVIAAKAVAFREALRAGVPAYAEQIVRQRAGARRRRSARRAAAIVSGGTDNHLMLVDVRPLGVTGKQARTALGEVRHHREQEHDPVRPREADDRRRDPDRHARGHDARHAGGGDGARSRPHRRGHRGPRRRRTPRRRSARASR